MISLISLTVSVIPLLFLWHTVYSRNSLLPWRKKEPKDMRRDTGSKEEISKELESLRNSPENSKSRGIEIEILLLEGISVDDMGEKRERTYLRRNISVNKYMRL